jgi:hypothetical protein
MNKEDVAVGKKILFICSSNHDFCNHKYKQIGTVIRLNREGHVSIKLDNGEKFESYLDSLELMP